MKPTHIATLPTDDSQPAEKRQVRERAPKYIESIINDTRAIGQLSSLQDLRPEHIEPLGGGVDAATYLIHTPDVQVIVKFAHQGLEAEAEALRAWRKQHARVPDVIAYGIVPITKGQKKPVKYVIQSAMLTPNGRVVETCANYLAHYPTASRAVGRLLGTELSKIHSAIADRSYGEFADSPGNTAAYESWNAYMAGFLDAQVDYLTKLKIADEQIAAVKKTIQEHKFIARGRYLHGDFSIRNAAVKSYEPLKVALFDPNPVVGDPTWDIATLFNNYEFQKRRMDLGSPQQDLYLRDQQLLIGFKQTYRRRIKPGSLLISQLLQATLQARYKEGAERTADNRVDIKVRQEFVRYLIETLSGKEQ